MSDHITYAWHVATEELVGRMTAAEQRVKELEAKSLEDSAEISGLQNTVISQGELLTGVVNAIRGEPPHNTLWSHHDAPQLAERMKAENAKLLKDAERYRWLREQHWSHSQFAVAANPKASVKLGAYCPSGELLDECIDEHCGRHEPRKERCLT